MNFRKFKTKDFYEAADIKCTEHTSGPDVVRNIIGLATDGIFRTGVVLEVPSVFVFPCT